MPSDYPRPRSPASTPAASTQEFVLPSLVVLPSLSISPQNSSLRFSPSPSHSFVHSHSPSHSIPPLGGSLPRSCRLSGCANFAKIHGYCVAHYHVESESVAAASTPSTTPLLPPLRLDHPRSLERPMLHHQPAVYYTPSAASIHNHHSPLFHHHHHVHHQSQQQQQLPSLALRRFSEPVAPHAAAFRPLLQPPPPAQLPLRSPLHRRQSVDSFVSLRRSTPRSSSGGEALKPSPTNSTGSSPKARCRREHCTNAARRKGLCMEHGGRHFCKMDGCHKCAHRGGYCIAHGGGRRCAVDKCTKSAQSGGVCYSHGGGKRCATDGCSHAARSGGFCIKHGKMLKQKESSNDEEEDDDEDAAADQ